MILSVLEDTQSVAFCHGNLRRLLHHSDPESLGKVFKTTNLLDDWRCLSYGSSINIFQRLLGLFCVESRFRSRETISDLENSIPRPVFYSLV